eukprot:2583321-Rhodomonas_salina.2
MIAYVDEKGIARVSDSASIDGGYLWSQNPGFTRQYVHLCRPNVSDPLQHSDSHTLLTSLHPQPARRVAVKHSTLHSTLHSTVRSCISAASSQRATLSACRKSAHLSPRSWPSELSSPPLVPGQDNTMVRVHCTPSFVRWRASWRDAAFIASLERRRAVRCALPSTCSALAREGGDEQGVRAAAALFERMGSQGVPVATPYLRNTLFYIRTIFHLSARTLTPHPLRDSRCSSPGTPCRLPAGARDHMSSRLHRREWSFPQTRQGHVNDSKKSHADAEQQARRDDAQVETRKAVASVVCKEFRVSVGRGRRVSTVGAAVRGKEGRRQEGSDAV